MLPLPLWHLCCAVWVTEGRCGSRVVIKSRSAAVKHGASRGDNAYWQKSMQMSTGPFHANLMQFTTTAKLNSFFVEGGGEYRHKVRGKSRATEELRRFGRTRGRREHTLLLLLRSDVIFSCLPSLLPSGNLHSLLLALLVHVCSVQPVGELSSGYWWLKRGTATGGLESLETDKTSNCWVNFVSFWLQISKPKAERRCMSRLRTSMNWQHPQHNITKATKCLLLIKVECWGSTLVDLWELLRVHKELCLLNIPWNTHGDLGHRCVGMYCMLAGHSSMHTQHIYTHRYHAQCSDIYLLKEANQCLAMQVKN